MSTDFETYTIPRTTPTLDHALDDELAFSPSVQRYFSSHLAMAMVALHQLGAEPNVIQATLDRHARQSPELRDDRPVLDARIEEVVHLGIEAAVRERVPALVRGPGSQLFHPMIRLAYALDVGHAGQTAAALLDWERRHQVLPVPEVRTGERRLRHVAADLAAQRNGRWQHTFDLAGIARRSELHAALDGLAIDEATLDDISSFAIAAHVTADDFITLHLVTGARALRAIVPHVDHDVALQLVAHSASVMAVAYAAVGAPALMSENDLERVRRLDLPDRKAIADRAIADTDPHVIKLANVALVEEARTSDPLYRYAAARAVGLLGS